MKTVDLRRFHLAPGIVENSEIPAAALRAPMPPSIARIPLVDLCVCRHPRESHEHPHRSATCAQCDCADFVRWEPRG